MIYSTELAIVAASVLALGGAGFGVRRMVQHVDKRIHLMLRASYHNSRDIKENLETVDMVRSETRKALEHQRVLLSSLNQQIKNLESTIAGGNLARRTESVSVFDTVTQKAALEPAVKKAVREKSEKVAHEKPVFERLSKKKAKKANAKKAKKEGLLGHLDEFLERGIEQIVANDVCPETYAKFDIELVEETQVPVRNFAQELAAEPAPQAAPVPASRSNVEQEAVASTAIAPKEVKRDVAAARRGGVISMDKLLKQQKQQRAIQGEKTEKIVKLSSIFANKGRVAQAS